MIHGPRMTRRQVLLGTAAGIAVTPLAALPIPARAHERPANGAPPATPPAPALPDTSRIHAPLWQPPHLVREGWRAPPLMRWSWPGAASGVPAAMCAGVA
jgi:hypothetical protein